ncbi:LAME_0G06568g1_1 [Lachancea meyersii CBS 8951]|uniref:LAME_0G06568g1_1 n=1 Tax=Lachancea meyersii CBS 8951 TaxID=1266667 RepID=A0A1G4K7J8_9SACH|nr:LAME_0G06568g1_1 [Lachancea meyersii CBS 8951]
MPDTASTGFQLGPTLDASDVFSELANDHNNDSIINTNINTNDNVNVNDSSNDNNNNNNNNLDNTHQYTSLHENDNEKDENANANTTTSVATKFPGVANNIINDARDDQDRIPIFVQNDITEDGERDNVALNGTELVVPRDNLNLDLETSKTTTTTSNRTFNTTNSSTANEPTQATQTTQPAQLTVADNSRVTPPPVDQFQSQLAHQSDAIALLNSKLQQVENSACTTDEGLNELLGNLAASTRNLAHNQQVLENKLEDLLRNQVNTDSSVNALLNKLHGVSQSIDKAVKSNALAAANVPQSIHRGPGRPPKTRNGLASVAAALSMTSRESLPDSNVGLPRSRRMFQDPDTSLDAEAGVSGHVRSLRQQQQAQNSSSSTSSNQGLPAPKKRGPGRPPKRKHHWAERKQGATARGQEGEAQSATGGSDGEQAKADEDDEEVDEEDDDEEYRASEEPKLEDDDFLARSLGENSAVQVDDSYYGQKTNRGRGRPSSKSSDKGTPLTSAQIKMQQELERRRDAREQMLVSMKYSDRNKAKVFMESNKELLRAMREEERRKRMTAFNYDSHNHSGGPTPNNTTGNNSLSPNAASGVGGRRLSQFAPLTQGSDDFAAGNHGTEAQRSATEEGGPGTPPSESTQEATATPTLASIAASSDYATPVPPLPRKVGILSMLNEDEGESSGNKRRMPELFEDGFSPEFPNKRERSEEGRDFRSIIPMLPEKKDNRGRPANSSSSGDNSTALLLASPVELICRDGFFYRKSDPELPITTGNYLEFKFKSKEDDLIRLNLSQSDYAELTRQDRINAYFLKPDIERETDFACRLLSKSVLTERYVNSLEYFTMEFRWENRLVGLGLKLRESKRTWQRRKALFALFEFWRDKSREKRGFAGYTMMHAVKEMENYRIFINRSVSWFYNHITLLKMILYDLCDNTRTQWREWMFPRGQQVPVLGGSFTEDNLNEAIDQVLALDFLEDGTDNRENKGALTNVVVETTATAEQPKND